MVTQNTKPALQPAKPVCEYDWDTDTMTVYPKPDAAAAWQQAVVQAAQGLNVAPWQPRLQAAMDLVLAGAVDDRTGEAPVVTSGSHTYVINELEGCPCQDAQHRSKWCKHAVALALFRNARAILHPEEETRPMAETPRPTPETPRPTPPARCTIKWRHGGVEYLYTVEADTDAAVLARLDAVLAARPADAGDAPAPPTPAQATPVPDVPAPCPRHGSAKIKRSKFKGFYCAARDEAGTFCTYELKD